jgi:two-component system, cell cycle sensor histidine kinase and response regulator CckA
MESGASKTILLLEGEYILRTLVATALRVLGYRVIEAENRQAAVQIWQQHRASIDMLLSDWEAQEGSPGWMLAKEFRDSKPGLIVILISSPGVNTKVGEEAPEHFYYLPKPYTMESMFRTVQDCFTQV